ncbi:hypothetical protein PHYPSEUDO_007711 [Phytophthora pseudosyringae]|uniref:Uncharacterized protein n=1 Tax=Phytophthora pseudosyringae TaxID=221518 RepID=A0A8T1WB14_9STRA|nr:hypothetical protein PHYPSEUDO_007711 [Phytophthora pseudosyringae]
MQHLGAASVNRKPRPRIPIGSSTLPDGWYSVEPQSRKAHARSGPDALGLTNTVDPLTFLARKPSSRWPEERGATKGKQQQNPRRRRLRENAGESVFPAAEVFSPQRSLRLAKLPMLTTKERRVQPEIREQSNQLMVVTPTLTLPSREPELPLHELIQTVDDAVKADPLAELNQSAIARLFMDQWLQQFEADRRSFKSVAVRYEVGFEELQRRTVNLPRPNELITSFCCKVLGRAEDLTPHFGPYAPLFLVLSAELIQSIYARDGLPYFALVKHHQRLLLTLRKDKEWREERNDVLADDIGNVYSMFRRFLSECTYALSRMLLREWYSVAIVQNKNNRKYVTYYSNWFSSAPRAILHKVFVAWKRESSLHRIEKTQKQMQIDLHGLTVIKRQVDDLTRQRDIAQADNLAMRNDRKLAEDWAKRLELQIKAASTYLDTTRRREAQVCQEGQLRVEAVACLPPLVLESLLRGYHGVGFLQQAPDEEAQVSPAVLGDMSASPAQKDGRQATCSALQECLAEVGRLRNIALRRTSSTMHAGRSNSVVATGRSNSVIIAAESGDQLSPSLQVAAAAVATTSILPGRRAGGAVSHDELSGRRFAKFFSSLRDQIQAAEAKVLFTPMTEDQIDKQQSQHENAPLAREYGQLLRAIRVQDEHYASHSKLFSSRMLESHETSLVPNRSMPNRALQATDGFAGTDQGELGIINGVKRFWVASVTAMKPRTTSRSSQLRRASTRRQSICTPKDRSPPQTPLLETLGLLHESDFDISPLHSRGFTILLLTHAATEYGALLFSPADMSAFTHNAYVQPPSEKEAEDSPSTTSQDVIKARPSEENVRSTLTPPPAQSSQSPSPAELPTFEQTPLQNTESTTNVSDPLLVIQPIVTAYNTWNQISEQLIAAGVVQSRGLTPRAIVDPPNEGSSGDLKIQGTVLGTPVRPMLQHQFEPLSHSSFLGPPRDKPGRRLSFTSGDGNTYHTARTRHLPAEGTERLTQSIEAIHKCVKATSANMKDFSVTHQQLRELRVTQWQQASELAFQFAAKPKEAPASTSPRGQTDNREQVHECISLTNSTMRRIFSVEENPEVELSLVRAVLEKHQRVIRQLYTPFGVNMKHAMSLDGLWHVVKMLRLPREIHVLPILRDEELVANGYEQLFSPENLAELFLQLCNEQFQPQIAPLSARVEFFITHHLPTALQNQSLLRALMHRSDVKLAIYSHSQTIRIIFRRYCAKERELMMPATGPTKPKPRHTGHGINKYMRMVDWQAFIQDYHLVRARFSMEQAMSVFRNVQEAPPGSDDQLELIYSEFCEALVGMATFYFPDPFIKTATKVTQFLRRYLPLSPEDAHDHA